MIPRGGAPQVLGAAQPDPPLIAHIGVHLQNEDERREEHGHVDEHDFESPVGEPAKCRGDV